jgi:hypothetical protein
MTYAVACLLINIRIASMDRTACVIGCLRKLQRRKLSGIIDEYRLYAGPKAQPLGEQFIAAYEPGIITESANEVKVVDWGC